MSDYDYLKMVNDGVKMYADFPMPVLLCDRDFLVHWSNKLAKSLYYHLTGTEGLRAALAEFDLCELCERVERDGTCTLVDALPLNGARISVSPMLHNSEMAGLVIFITDTITSPDSPGVYKISRTADALTGNIRGAMSEVFSAMDETVSKAGALGAEWLKSPLNRIGISGYEILRIAENMSEFARYQSGIQEMNFTAVNLPGWLRDISSALDAIGETFGIPITVEASQCDCFIRLDMAKFELALFNILHNSLYFTKPGNEVTVKFEKNGGFVSVVVIDRGIGIPESDLPSIFRPYTVCTNGGVGAGMGLGLAIARGIIHAHDGGIEIDSTPGEGTTVTLTLPENPFSLNLPLRQGADKLILGDRFSSLYTGLMGAAKSPYRDFTSLTTAPNYRTGQSFTALET